ncbi:MAG: hypothetical protein Q8O79_03645 [Pseudomonadota bacterium]|nr:hypothetical protein [Pseudomonadota bacterium]
MKKTRYFSDLIKSYLDEVDDLVTDSEGKSVLQKRLNIKRREIDAILPMIEFSPEMVAVAFYDAFRFQSPETMQRIVSSEPGHSDFLAWAELKDQLTIADWAEPLIKSSLKVQGGDAFLVTTAALEFLRNKDSFTAPAPEQEIRKERSDDGDDDDEGDMEDLGEAGADWLVEQGFESLEH